MNDTTITGTSPVELVLDAKVYVYVDLDDGHVTHIEIDYDRQPDSYDGPDGTREEAWKIALGPGHASWPTPTWT